MKILVTGANGQLGNELRNLSTCKNSMQFLFTDYQELDITNNQAISDFYTREKPDFVINCAAYTAVDKAENDLEKATALNATAVANLVDGCKTCDAIFVHISTDYVFDGEKPTPYTEEDTPNPMSVYGSTKLKGEKIALAYAKTIAIRTAWLYSPYGNNFVKTMLRLGNERPEINVVNDQIGSPTYAEDLAKAIIKIIETIAKNPNKTQFGLYQFSNAGQCSWFDFATKIMQFGKRNCVVKPIASKDYPTPTHRPKFSLLSKEKIIKTYDVEVPQWEISLEKCIEILEK